MLPKQVIQSGEADDDTYCHNTYEYRADDNFFSKYEKSLLNLVLYKLEEEVRKYMQRSITQSWYCVISCLPAV